MLLIYDLVMLRIDDLYDIPHIVHELDVGRCKRKYIFRGSKKHKSISSDKMGR